MGGPPKAEVTGALLFIKGGPAIGELEGGPGGPNGPLGALGGMDGLCIGALGGTLKPFEGPGGLKGPCGIG
jgi:hypothetical protein